MSLSYSSATFAHSRPSTAISSSCSASALAPVGTSMAAACRQEIVFQEVFHRLGTEAWDGLEVNLLDIPFGEVLFFLRSNVLSAKPVPFRDTLEDSLNMDPVALLSDRSSLWGQRGPVGNHGLILVSSGW